MIETHNEMENGNEIISLTKTINPIEIDLGTPKSIYDIAYIIIPSPTGVFFESQCGGSCCVYKKVEGFIIKVPPSFKVLDEDEEGCKSMEHRFFDYEKDKEIIKSIFDKRKEVAWILNDRFKNIDYSSFDFPITHISFNFDKVDELREAWWPILLNWNGKNLSGYMTGWNYND